MSKTFREFCVKLINVFKESLSKITNQLSLNNLQ